MDFSRITILFTCIANHSRGSVLLAWVFHAAINVSGALRFIGDQPRKWWLSGLGFSVVAVAIAAITGPNLARRPAAGIHRRFHPSVDDIPPTGPI